MSDSHESSKTSENPEKSGVDPSHPSGGDSHTTSGGHGSEKSGAPAKTAPWKSSAGAAVRQQKESFGILLKGFRSSDPKVRRMAFLFVLSLLGAMTLFAAAGLRFYQGVQETRKVQAERDAANTMSAFLSRQAEERRRRVFSSNLGEFTFELNEGPGREGGDGDSNVQGVTGLAEAEIIVECDTAETCEWIDQSLPAVRHQVTIALTEVNRDELINRDGKRRLRKAIVDRLNQLLPHGRVLNAYFGRLMID